VEAASLQRRLEELATTLIVQRSISHAGSAEAARALLAFLNETKLAHVVLDPVTVLFRWRTITKDGFRF